MSTLIVELLHHLVTLSDAAQDIGVSKVTLWRWERQGKTDNLPHRARGADRKGRGRAATEGAAMKICTTLNCAQVRAMLEWRRYRASNPVLEAHGAPTCHQMS